MAIGVKFITGIRYHKSALEMLNNMTFVYDPSWKIDNTVKPTLPVCFFHVKNYHEVMTSEVSQRQMLFYNSALGANDSDPAVDSGLLNVVADNIVIKPKTYKLDVVIPYHNLTLLDQSFVYNTHTAQALTSVFIGDNDTTTKANKILGTYATLSQPYLQLIRTIVKSLATANYDSTVENWISNITHQPDYNKESIEAMWRLRHIVKMKMWNSWSYKYVAIVDMDINKEGTEDGVYEATLTVQEMPIVTMYPENSKTLPVFTYKNKLLETSGKKIIDTLDWAGSTFGA